MVNFDFMLTTSAFCLKFLEAFQKSNLSNTMTSLILLKEQTLKLTSPELVNLGIWGLRRENRPVLCGGHCSQQTGA